jgi:UTP:GlnB (protein PII) uridylyltransferase
VPGTLPPPDALRAFAESLPPAYRSAFDVQAIAAHMRLANERGSKLANVGSFPSNSAPGTAVCVVADDRPGLLALISAAMLMTELDVICGEAYTRRKSAGYEAVDVFWLRHADPEQRKLRVQRNEIADLEETLIALLEGRIDPRTAAERHTPLPPSISTGTVVRFLEDDDGGLATLEVETGDRSGLLHSLSHALFEQSVQIVQSEVKTLGERVFDRFSVVELDGSPITPARRLQIQVGVLSAIEPIPVLVRRDKSNARASDPGESR